MSCTGSHSTDSDVNNLTSANAQNDAGRGVSVSNMDTTESSSGEPSKKRRRTREHTSTCLRSVCVIHVPGLKTDSYGDIKTFSSTADAEETLSKLQEIKRRRLAEPLTSTYRMINICAQIPDKLSSHHGYHRECYQRFTMNLNSLSQKTKEQNASSRARRQTVDSIIFTPECIFCNSDKRKKIKVKGCWTTEGLCGFEFGGWQDLEQQAKMRNDDRLLTRIRGKDLFASEAKYHRSCRKLYYIPDPNSWRSENQEQKNIQLALEDAHRSAFNKVCVVIEEEVINSKRLLKLSDLKELYIAHLDETDFPNPDYRATKLKDKLQTHPKYSSALSFCQLSESGPQYHGYIMYNSSMSIDAAIRKAYELGSSNIIKESGMQLYGVINQSFKDADELKWPPNVLDLECNTKIPIELEMFLSLVFTKQTVPKTTKAQRLIQSIGQDICRAATGSCQNTSC